MALLQRIEKSSQARFLVTSFALIACAALGFLISNMVSDTVNGSQIVDRQVPSLVELYPEALDQARSWRDDAYMIYADIDFHPERFSTAFAFGTLEDPNLALLVYFNENEDGYEVKLDESRGSGRTDFPPAIHRDDWSTDSPEVAQYAYDQRGSDFLDAHPEVNEAVLQLTWLSGAAAENTGLEAQRLVWVMHYYQLRGYSLRVYVDPLTGEIIGEELFEPATTPELNLDSE